jgi:ribosomal protein S8E
MRRLVLFWVVCLLLAASVSASPAQQAGSAAQNTPQITAFSSSASAVSRDDLVNRTARVPVSWTTVNRPLTSNLVFEQVLPNGATVNVELPRLLPWVVSSGQGLAAPISPGSGVNEIVLRARLVNLFNGQVLSERQLTLPVVNGGSSGNVGDRSSITSFTTTAAFVNVDQLENGTARVPVSWATANRLPTTTLVFEQVMADGSTVNVELPRDDPFVPSSGNGLAAPVDPGGDAASITLRASLFDLLNGRVYDLREITLPVLAAGATPTFTPTPTGTTAPAPDIRTFTLDAANLNSNELANGTSRVVVRWSVVNRPANSNLVFEQVLSSGTVVNVELPRSNPIVASEGQGLIAPRAPGGGAASARFVLSLVSLSSGQVYDRVEVTLPIVTVPTPTATTTATAQTFNLTFTTTVSSISRETLASGTARIPVSWSISPRPNNTNLYFEQVFADGTVVNVELPRSNPIVASSGSGAAAPVLPADSSANQIVLRVRLANLSTPGVSLTQRELILPLTGTVTATPVQTRLDVYTPSTTVIESSQFVSGAVIIPISWNVTGRPNNSNLVFDQVFPDGHSENAELPRPNPMVPSTGTGAVRLQDPGASITEVRVRVRLHLVGGTQVFAEREITIPIAGRSTVSGQIAEGTAEVLNIVPTETPTAEAQSAGPCQFGWFAAFVSGCPTGEAQEIAVTTQQFERGLMLLRSDSGQVYFFSNEGTVIIGQPGTGGLTTEPPSGLYAPSTAFEALWSANQERVGWATTPEGSYLATVQSGAEGTYITLPNGRIALISGANAWTTVG